MKLYLTKGLRLFAPFIFVLTSFSIPSAQIVDSTEKKAPPALQSNRAKENYDYLKSPASSPYKKGFGDALKYIPLNSDRTTYLNLGGSYRARVEHFTNQNWTQADVTYYSQRLTWHADLNIGKSIRFFGEIYHGFTSGTDRLFQDDKIDWHQGFLEIKLHPTEKSNLSFQLGRQELAFGATRLVGTRDGTNIRRSFDLGKVIYSRNKFSLQLFYGKEVNIGFGAFDNSFDLFEDSSPGPELWGGYLQFLGKTIVGNTEVYYFGFRSPTSGFSDVFGEETRHTIGIRRFGKIGQRISYNTELIYQFGTLGENTILAFDIETDWKYVLSLQKWKPTIGLKFDWSSGDKEKGDDKIQTFNPMFVNPAIYSLAAVNTPVNLSSLHPNFTLIPFKGFLIYLDYALFFRTSKEDGLYTPPRFQTRSAEDFSETHIGDALGLSIQYTINRNMSVSLMSSYFIPGSFIEVSGPSEATFFIAPTLSVKL